MHYYKDDVVVLSGSVEVKGLKGMKAMLNYDYNNFGNKIDRNDVYVVVYKTFRQHFAVIYPSVELICADWHICCINLKTSFVTLLPSKDKQEILIKPKNDFDSYELVFRIEVKDKNSLDLWLNALKSEDEEILTPFGSISRDRRRSTSRQSSLEKVEEDDEFR